MAMATKYGVGADSLLDRAVIKPQAVLEFINSASKFQLLSTFTVAALSLVSRN